MPKGAKQSSGTEATLRVRAAAEGAPRRLADFTVAAPVSEWAA